MMGYNTKCIDAGVFGIDCGREECTPGHFYGPHIRDYFLIHYVEKGEGHFKINEKTYYPKEGEIFFIPPWIITYYEADVKNPWTYKWVGLRAKNVKNIFALTGISAENPVIKVNTEISDTMDKIISEAGMENNNQVKIVMYVYEFLAELIEIGEAKKKYKTSGQMYVEKAMGYVMQNIYKKISVAELAGYIGVDRSYLTGIFKKYTGTSPQKYIIDVKMKAACKYLERTEYDITYIARSVGYDDLFVFSHAFKNVMGKSPKNYRDEIKKS